MEEEIVQKPFWSYSTKQTLETLNTTEEGLTTEEASKRQKLFGKNKIEEKKRITKLALFLRQFKNPLIIILIIGAVVTILLGEIKDSIFISVAVIFNAWLGFYQENKAEEALASLNQYITKTVRVYRDGGERKIKTEDLVPGDVIRLSQGDHVPADCRILYQNDLRANEAILTGESVPAEKQTSAVSKDAVVGDRTSMLFNGSTITQGIVKAVVTATSQKTELGKIADLVLQKKNEQTPLQKQLTSFAIKSSVVLLILTIGVFFVARNSGIETVEAFLISVAILVSAVPEGLPIVMTVILAIGVTRLARKNGVIRKLAAAETLGSTTVILTDKTGTLTQAKMALTDTIVTTKHKHFLGEYDEKHRLLELALLNVDATVENEKDPVSTWEILGKPLEVALVRGAGEAGIRPKALLQDKRQVYYLPFTSKNKFSASIYEVPNSFLKKRGKEKTSYIQSVLGAPEIILEHSDASKEEKEAVLKEIDTRAAKGERLVAIGVKEIKDINDLHAENKRDFKGLDFLGFFSLKDPLRPNVKQVISEVKEAGIRIIMATGDHAGTAKSIAEEAGLEVQPGGVISGKELEHMTEQELRQRLSKIQVIARVSPAGKQKLVDALQKEGEIVAMNGDGVNDAPAIKGANIGIAMGAGTDITKSVADLVLLDDNFKTIAQAVQEGRRIISNIQKAIVYLSSAIFNEILLVGGSLLLGLPIPLNALQILWVNFFTDSFPGIALAFEDDIDDLKGKPTDLKKGLLNREMKTIIFINGLISTFALFGIYIYLLKRFDETTVKTFIFSAFATYTLFLGFSMRSLKKGIFQYNPFGNLYLVASIIFGFGLTLAALYIPLLQNLFGIVPLSGIWILGLIGFGLANVILIEITKFIFIKTTSARA